MCVWVYGKGYSRLARDTTDGGGHGRGACTVMCANVEQVREYTI